MTGLQNNLTDLQNKHELLEKSIETADQDLAAQEKPAEPKQSGGVKKFVLIGFLLGIVVVTGVAVVRLSLIHICRPAQRRQVHSVQRHHLHQERRSRQLPLLHH